MNSSITIAPFGPAATPAEVAAIESRLGVTLPEDYREFLLHTNGGKLTAPPGQYVAFPIVWSEKQSWGPEEYEDTQLRHLFTADRKHRYASLVWAHYAEVLESIRSQMPADTVPIAADGGANAILLGITGPNRGKIFYWASEAQESDEEEPTYDNVGFVANSFTEFLDKLYLVNE